MVSPVSRLTTFISYRNALTIIPYFASLACYLVEPDARIHRGTVLLTWPLCANAQRSDCRIESATHVSSRCKGVVGKGNERVAMEAGAGGIRMTTS